jgi:hypothetical protein
MSNKFQYKVCDDFIFLNSFFNFDSGKGGKVMVVVVVAAG